MGRRHWHIGVLVALMLALPTVLLADEGRGPDPGPDRRVAQTGDASQPSPLGHPGEASAAALGSWDRTAAALQALSALLMAVAVFYYALQARHARDAVRAGVSQALTDRMIGQMRFFCDRLDVARDAFPLFRDIPDEKAKVYMAVHPFLLHFENVLTLRKHLPKGQWPDYLASMKHILSLSPLMHEWLALSGAEAPGGVWSRQLQDIAAENRPLRPMGPATRADVGSTPHSGP